MRFPNRTQSAALAAAAAWEGYPAAVKRRPLSSPVGFKTQLLFYPSVFTDSDAEDATLIPSEPLEGDKFHSVVPPLMSSDTISRKVDFAPMFYWASAVICLLQGFFGPVEYGYGVFWICGAAFLLTRARKPSFAEAIETSEVGGADTKLVELISRSST